MKHPTGRRLAGVLSATLLALALFLVLSRAMKAADEEEPTPVSYLPLVPVSSLPAGSYWCDEYEYGLIWTSEVITLNPDGSSLYAYAPPYPDLVTGTWTYTSEQNMVGFTNFRWTTATFEMPDSIWARRYLSEAGFEIALICTRLRED